MIIVILKRNDNKNKINKEKNDEKIIDNTNTQSIQQKKISFQKPRVVNPSNGSYVFFIY